MRTSHVGGADGYATGITQAGQPHESRLEPSARDSRESPLQTTSTAEFERARPPWLAIAELVGTPWKRTLWSPWPP